jgi:hypothetical protein
MQECEEAMREPRVLVRDAAGKSGRLMAPDSAGAWRWIGWLGLVLAVVGLWDFALTWYPANWGSPEWEFATVTASYSGLPLPTMGLLALAASAIARGVRWQVRLLSIGLIGFAIALLLGFVLFLTTVPVALTSVEGIALVGIKKAIAKTAMIAVMFPGAYLAAGVVGLGHLRRGGGAR